MASPITEPKTAMPAAAIGNSDAQYDLEQALPCSDTETHCSEGSLSGDSSDGWEGSSGASSELPREGLSDSSGSDHKAVAAKSWRTRRSVGCLSCCSVTLVLITLLVVFLRPRYPDWHVQKLIVPPAALNSVIQAVTNPSGDIVTVGMDAVVELSNPNYLGAETGEGRFAITWEGHELASVTTEAGLASARSQSQVSAHATSVITPDLGKLMMQTLPSQGFKLQVNVKGHLPATVRDLFGLRVKVSLECVVDVSVLMIMSAPDKLVTGHKCKYGVGF